MAVATASRVFCRTDNHERDLLQRPAKNEADRWKSARQLCRSCSSARGGVSHTRRRSPGSLWLRTAGKLEGQRSRVVHRARRIRGTAIQVAMRRGAEAKYSSGDCRPAWQRSGRCGSRTFERGNDEGGRRLSSGMWRRREAAIAGSFVCNPAAGGGSLGRDDAESWRLWCWSCSIWIELSAGAGHARRGSRTVRLLVKASTSKDSSGEGGGRDGENGSTSSSFSSPSPAWDPLFAEGGAPGECPVPSDAQPINEYRSLLDSAFFPWATLSPQQFALRLAAIGLTFSALIGWPVASLSFRPEENFALCLLASLSGGLIASSAAVIRLYLGWAYVGNRLLSATVEYEESGWYDGAVWVKTPQVLARDRLLRSYEVKPTLGRLRVALIVLAVSLTGLTASIAILSRAPHGLTSGERALTGDVYVNDDVPRVYYSIPYRDESARKYEPGAFLDDDDGFESTAQRGELVGITQEARLGALWEEACVLTSRLDGTGKVETAASAPLRRNDVRRGLGSR